MRRLVGLFVPLFGVAARLGAQAPAAACTIPDSVAVEGNRRVASDVVRTTASVLPGATVDGVSVQKAIRALYTAEDFDDVQVSWASCAPTGRGILLIHVHERPLLSAVRLVGTARVPTKTARDLIGLEVGQPLKGSAVQTGITRIDSLYKSRGYYLARVRADTATMANEVDVEVTFHVEEGSHLSVSQVVIAGNSVLSDKTIVEAMHTKPEGFFFWKKGEYSDVVFENDRAESIPLLFGRKGLLDMQITHDTVIVDEQRGKASVVLDITEGPQYRVGSFEVLGNRRFSSEEVAQYYPFRPRTLTLKQRIGSLFRKRDSASTPVFDAEQWDAARGDLFRAYRNEGYIHAQIDNPIERTKGADSTPIVNMRMEIQEGVPAIIKRIDIAGNDYTHEQCIRRMIGVAPGSVYNEERLLRSYEQIANLGFFETPLPEPDIIPVDSADVNIVFNVKEKQTGTFNFGASVGQGAGLGGFIGLEQPNMFGRCKKATLQWQFGSLINDFQLSYADPAIRRSNFSGTINLYHTASKYIVQDFGREVRSGGAIQLGAPFFGSSYTRLSVTYGGEAVKYGNDTTSFLGQLAAQCHNCFRSTLGLQLARDTRIGLPFAFSGSSGNADAQFNGGPLGGTAKFQRYTAEEHAYAQLGQISKAGGGQPIILLAGLGARTGAVFGNTGPFFPSQEFAMGGTQQGQPLRGYDEFAITPDGVIGGNVQATRNSFGRAFFSTTAEVGARVSSGLYLNMFFDAGNVWREPRQFNPTRLYRGAGIGVGLVTPLGPLGLDWAYGFDRIDAFGQPDPGWKLHFRLGQLF